MPIDAMAFLRVTKAPMREYVLAGVVLLALAADYFLGLRMVLLLAVTVGSVMPLVRGIIPLVRGSITIDTFNAFALGVSLATGEFRSTAFILLMLVSAYV